MPNPVAPSQVSGPYLGLYLLISLPRYMSLCSHNTLHLCSYSVCPYVSCNHVFVHTSVTLREEGRQVGERPTLVCIASVSLAFLRFQCICQHISPTTMKLF